MTFKVIQGHLKSHYSIDHIWFCVNRTWYLCVCVCLACK